MQDESERLRDYARNHYGENYGGDLNPDSADWTAERIPLALLAGIMPGGAEAWIKWHAEEVEMYRADIAQSATDPVHWQTFAEEESDEEVIVSIDEHGVVEIWDGFHRVGGAFVRGALDIPAVVGRPKPSLPAP